MSNTFKIILILISIFSIVFTFNYTYATSDEGELVTSDTDDIANDEDTIINENASDTSSLSALSASDGTRVSTINSYSEANLQLNNILSIILISIGVLIILFAIALLIRIKK